MGETATRTEDGLEKVYPSPKPFGTQTFFAGAGDYQAIGDGERLLFKLNANTVSKSANIIFSEDVYIKDGFVTSDGAPLGAYLDVDIIHQTYGKVGAFAKKCALLGTGNLQFISNDRTLLNQGLALRVTVYNASGIGDEDNPSDFRVAGFLQIYRASTI
ncbi:MAG: hypothetical protein BWK78_00405 [Thiotrichaceae bacterium IS1]|nr:MAG: hypothetical protein BWK78_00405 [Thiotrichaceae bacterium IS1]